jgi:hypothetical protein
MRRLVLLVALLGLLAPGTARAAIGVVDVRGPDGAVIAQDGGGAFSFPSSGAVVQVSAALFNGRAVDLRGVSLLAGEVTADRIIVPAQGLGGARIVGLRIAGTLVAGGPNTLIPLGGSSYLVALQEAVAPQVHTSRVGVVGLRLHLGTSIAGLPAGSEIWVGLAAAARRVPPQGAIDGIPGRLVPLYTSAGARYGIPWSVLAAINRVETGFGHNLNVSSAGAIGWMQFLPSTWKRWSVDGDGDGRRNPYDPADAILTAARYLAAAGGADDIAGAIWSYNHSPLYVAEVLQQATVYDEAAPDARASGALDPSSLGAS